MPTYDPSEAFQFTFFIRHLKLVRGNEMETKGQSVFVHWHSDVEKTGTKPNSFKN